MVIPMDPADITTKPDHRLGARPWSLLVSQRTPPRRRASIKDAVHRLTTPQDQRHVNSMPVCQEGMRSHAIGQMEGCAYAMHDVKPISASTLRRSKAPGMAEQEM